MCSRITFNLTVWYWKWSISFTFLCRSSMKDPGGLLRNTWHLLLKIFVKFCVIFDTELMNFFLIQKAHPLPVVCLKLQILSPGSAAAPSSQHLSISRIHSIPQNFNWETTWMIKKKISESVSRKTRIFLFTDFWWEPSRWKVLGVSPGRPGPWCAVQVVPSARPSPGLSWWLHFRFSMENSPSHISQISESNFDWNPATPTKKVDLKWTFKIHKWMISADFCQGKLRALGVRLPWDGSTCGSHLDTCPAKSHLPDSCMHCSFSCEEQWGEADPRVCFPSLWLQGWFGAQQCSPGAEQPSRASCWCSNPTWEPVQRWARDKKL